MFVTLGSQKFFLGAIFRDLGILTQGYKPLGYKAKLPDQWDE